MTCIVALVEAGHVYMGGDTLGVENGTHHALVRADEKVFWNGPLLIGFCGSFRMGQVVRYRFRPPTPPEDPSEMISYLSTEFADELRASLEEGGLLLHGVVPELPGNLVIGYQGRIYEMESDLGVSISRHPFISIGCGFAYALGSLYSTKGTKPVDRINKALEAAAEFNGGVRGPFTVLSTRPQLQVNSGGGKRKKG